MLINWPYTWKGHQDVERDSLQHLMSQLQRISQQIYITDDTKIAVGCFFHTLILSIDILSITER